MQRSAFQMFRIAQFARTTAWIMALPANGFRFRPQPPGPFAAGVLTTMSAISCSLMNH